MSSILPEHTYIIHYLCTTCICICLFIYLYIYIFIYASIYHQLYSLSIFFYMYSSMFLSFLIVSYFLTFYASIFNNQFHLWTLVSINLQCILNQLSSQLSDCHWLYQCQVILRTAYKWSETSPPLNRHAVHLNWEKFPSIFE